MIKQLARAGLTIVAAAAAVVLGAAPALAAQGSIDHVESSPGKVQILYSLPQVGGISPTADLGSISVTFDGTKVPATAEVADTATNTIKRTAILAIDVSNSMKANGKFAQAKLAANAFLKNAPPDLYVGIVTFSSQVTVAQRPSLNRARTSQILGSLKLSSQTRLYDGVKQAVSVAGTTGQRSIVVLTDGQDTTGTSLASVVSSINNAGELVDAVSLATSTKGKAALTQIADAGHGRVLTTDPATLQQVFKNEANQLASQLLVTGTVPAGLSGKEGNLAVSVKAAGKTYSDSAFVTMSTKPLTTPVINTNPVPVAPGRFLVSRNVMLGGVVALALGLIVLIFALLGGTGNPRESIEHRIAAYARPTRTRAQAPPSHEQTGVGAQAVEVAQRALHSNADLEQKLGTRLDGAGMSLKPPEWLLMHAGIAVGTSFVLFLLFGTNVIMGAVGLLVGLAGPWFYLGFRRSRRVKAFAAQLAPTLQLMAGSLQAGLSLPQTIDTVVREGTEPIASEFRRALVETRLGVGIEEALEPIGERMESEDFKWTVMAVRIQREVGGNLAELLLQVAATLRERDYLRRQVKALSAEGRFSSYILLCLPPGLIMYMLVANRGYLHPLLSTGIGFVMIGIMVILMSVGAFVMQRMVKLDV
jgi:tight adherence protein B